MMNWREGLTLCSCGAASSTCDTRARMRIAVRLVAFTAQDNRHRCALTSTNQCETRPDLEFSVGFTGGVARGKRGEPSVISFQVGTIGHRYEGNGRLMRFYAKKARL